MDFIIGFRCFSENPVIYSPFNPLWLFGQFQVSLILYTVINIARCSLSCPLSLVFHKSFLVRSIVQNTLRIVNVYLDSLYITHTYWGCLFLVWNILFPQLIIIDNLNYTAFQVIMWLFVLFSFLFFFNHSTDESIHFTNENKPRNLNDSIIPCCFLFMGINTGVCEINVPN